MAEIKTDALILKTIPFKETSYIVRLYTREKGKLAAIAKGARRDKSDFRGKLEPLNYLETILYYKDSRNVQTLGETNVKKSFLENHQDVSNTYYTMGILEALDKFITGSEDSIRIFNLTISLMNFIDSKPNIAKGGLVFFLLNLAEIIGFKINLDNCSICNNDLQKGYYNTKIDHLICEECKNSKDLEIQEDGITFLRNIEKGGLNEIKPSNVSNNSLTSCGKFLLKYLGWHMEVSPVLKSLKILRRMQKIK